MIKLKFEDIVFWILILLIIAVALWMLSGSPTEANALIAVSLFVATSELFLWKALFKVDKRTVVGFEKIKTELKEIKYLIKNEN